MPALPPPPPRRPAFNPVTAVLWLQSCRPLLSECARRLVADLARQTYPFTPRQTEKLREVVARAEGRCGAAATEAEA